MRLEAILYYAHQLTTIFNYFQFKLQLFIFQELGFSYLELNASDARNKKSIKEHVADVLNNHTIRGLTEKGKYNHPLAALFH